MTGTAPASEPAPERSPPAALQWLRYLSAVRELSVGQLLPLPLGGLCLTRRRA